MNRQAKRQLLYPVILLLAAAAIAFVAWPEPDKPAPVEPATATPGEITRNPGRELPTRDRPVRDTAQPDPVQVERPRQPHVIKTDLPRLLVSGRVETPHGLPVANAEVLFSGELALRGMHGRAVTDGGGNYRLLAWTAAELARSPSTDRRGSLSARSVDGGVGVARAENIPQGDTYEMPPLVIHAGGTIEGRIETADGAPASGASVSIRSAQAVPMAEERAGGPRIGERHLQRQVHADDRGAFKLAALPAGTYRITGDAGYFGQNTDALIVEVSEGRITTAVIKLRGENYLRGQVVDAMGMPVAGAIVQLRGEGVALGDGLLQPIQDRDRIGLRRQNDGNTGIRRFAERTAAARQFTDADGRFGFYSLQDKPYALVARLGSVEAQLENLPVNGPDAVLRLGETGGRVVSGYATDSATGLPVTAFDVRVVARADSTDPDPFTRVSPDRTFPWRPAGAYRVMDAPSEDFSIRISAPGYVPLIIPVDGLGQAEHRANVEAQLVPLCNLTVTPTQDGARLDLEPVLLLFEGYLAYQGATDELGHARIPDVAPGSYTLKLILRNGTVLQAALDVPAQREAQINLSLAPAG